MAMKSEYQVREIYNKNNLKIVRVRHKNGSDTLHASYKGSSDNPQEILAQLTKYQSEIALAIAEQQPREPNEALDSFLERTDNTQYVDNMGFTNGEGLILGAYIPAKDKSVILKSIPYALVDAINRTRYSRLEQILGGNSAKHKKTVTPEDIKRFSRVHEVAHRRRRYTGEPQNEESVDLEAAVVTGEYPIIRFPSVLGDMYDPHIREQVLNRPGMSYVRNAA